jgi:hypothetical protein
MSRRRIYASEERVDDVDGRAWSCGRRRAGRVDAWGAGTRVRACDGGLMAGAHRRRRRLLGGRAGGTRADVYPGNPQVTITPFSKTVTGNIGANTSGVSVQVTLDRDGTLIDTVGHGHMLTRSGRRGAATSGSSAE